MTVFSFPFSFRFCIIVFSISFLPLLAIGNFVHMQHSFIFVYYTVCQNANCNKKSGKIKVITELQIQQVLIRIFKEHSIHKVTINKSSEVNW